MAMCTLVSSSRRRSPSSLAYARHGDALGAPCETPRSGEYLDGAQHLVHIVHRFAHAHEHYVGQRLRVRYGEYLVDDAGRAQVAVIALTPCHAESAPHPAPRLGGDAESGAVAVGDIHGLYVTAPGPACEVAFGREEILDSAVGRARRKPWSGASHGVILFEGRTGRLGQARSSRRCRWHGSRRVGVLSAWRRKVAALSRRPPPATGRA